MQNDRNHAQAGSGVLSSVTKLSRVNPPVILAKSGAAMTIPVTWTFTHVVQFLTYLAYAIMTCLAVVYIYAWWTVYQQGILRLVLKNSWRQEVRRASSYLLVLLAISLGQIVATDASLGSDETVRVASGTITVILLSLILFILKSNQPFKYGLIEFVFAVCSGAFSLSTKFGSNFSKENTIILCSAVYLMIRSFDNMWKGIVRFNDECEKVEDWIKPLSNMYLGGLANKLFAARVKSTDELFVVSTALYRGRVDSLGAGMIVWNRDYEGILFPGSRVADFWTPESPTIQKAVFRGSKISFIHGSHVVFKEKKGRRYAG